MKILFISEILPLATYASEVVFYRHFTKLAADGYEIHLITDRNSYQRRKTDLSPLFKVHVIPNREWYYPPFKPYGILQYIRFNIYYYRFVKPIIKKHKIDTLFGFVNGNFLLALTAFVQNKTSLPLLSFFHDDTNELNFHIDSKWINRNTAKILEASQLILTASDGFAENWKEFSNKFSLLYPIPAEDQDLLSSNKPLLAIGYAGSVYNEIIPVLEKFSDCLSILKIPFTIIGNNKNADYLDEKYENVTSLPLFKTAEEASQFLIENCKFCIIPYPEDMDTMPWIKTCFPSKFIQYCKLGIPTIVIAPAESAIGKWCLANSWLLYLDTYDFDKIKQLIQATAGSDEVKAQVEFFRRNTFDPQIIHQQFLTHLAQLS